MAQMLPPDALYLIFLHACASPIGDLSPKVLSLSPMNFANVCRSWREVVAERPSLWGHLDVNFRSLGSLTPNLSQVVETWLRNSGSAPLNLRLKFNLESAVRNSEFEAMVSRILSQAHRWKDVVLQLHYPFLQEFLGEISLPPMPFLTSLCIGCGPMDAGNIGIRFDVSHCQHLQSLTLRFGVKMGLFERERYRLDSLTFLNLDVDNSGFEDFQGILQSSPNLSELDVSFSSSSGFDRLPHLEAESLSLPNLTYLFLIDENRILMVRLLKWLICPNLRLMYIQNTYSESALSPHRPEVIYVVTTELLQALDDFFHRSCPPLTQLELQYEAKEGDIPSSSHQEYSQIFSRMLHRLNGLKGLYLEGFVIDDQLIQEMIVTKNATEFKWPRLGEVKLLCEGHGVLSRSMVDMLISRWDSGVLKYLEYRIPGVVDLVNEFPSVEKRVNEGLVLRRRRR
ncbi:hypothetical protein SCHPADRAFT_994577 [Schizopora paradoxa]|uniref:Uncharacterized protein n=1 Tax=Schizopora paradoxa TaxID=27342 RepID=A0A0H2SJ47_9AGAM|nr:hypothetical protein SCHPADRAFT_994577 [Schizopora paradoxa]